MYCIVKERAEALLGPGKLSEYIYDDISGLEITRNGSKNSNYGIGSSFYLRFI
jgi:hypothetical protein